MYVWIGVCVLLLRFPPFFFFFFFLRVFFPQAATVHVRYMNSSRNFWPVFCEQYICALFTNPQISFFINFFIKNGSYSTIYTFKNYFATVISAISFQFQQNKSYPNRPLLSICMCKLNKVREMSKMIFFFSPVGVWIDGTYSHLYCSFEPPPLSFPSEKTLIKKYYLLLVHYKNFSYTTTNIAYFLYMVRLKITI